MDLFLDETKKFLLLLLKEEVEFIVIGGYAVIYHGYERVTADMDLLINPDDINKEKLLKTFREFGILEEDIALVKNLDFNKPQVFHIGVMPNKIDFLTRIAGVTFAEANEKKILLPLMDQQIPILQLEHLVTNKMLSERLKDKADVEELQKILRFKKNPDS